MNLRKNHYFNVSIDGYSNCQIAIRSNLSGGAGDNNYLIAQLRYGEESRIKTKHITLSATELRQLFGVKNKKESIMII